MPENAQTAYVNTNMPNSPYHLNSTCERAVKPLLIKTVMQAVAMGRRPCSLCVH